MHLFRNMWKTTKTISIAGHRSQIWTQECYAVDRQLCKYSYCNACKTRGPHSGVHADFRSWPAFSTITFLRHVGNIYETTRPTILPGAALTDLTAVCSNRVPDHGNSTASTSTIPTVKYGDNASQSSTSEIPEGTAPRTDSRPPKYHTGAATRMKKHTQKRQPIRSAYAHMASQS
jgi:hypothetical protein